ncbi:hypothetical protein M758_1G115700 [Ceratodon purpureus]|uniref:Pescadillo homolog n=1 Tax=Ceratodon purpureus TaxID=3225 RepID=A0A8T0J596_CERPU|nr:hypothetical protein KC19_1G121200 [Ceratodon purpureus]KAG0590706.1 hypothetical protein KC19_1G121200 [Ceratodon purpureus]KAG0629596.1 hypothetical protein M758_1G115700 [Ceratodon purpureus]
MTKPTKHKSKSKQYLAPTRRKEGQAAKYITRNKALNRLQIKLPEFRRLCILKGIHPREPKKKVEGHNKTYYHVKDIAFLAHEPLLDRSRELKAYEKKITKARAKRNLDLVQRLLGNKPEWNLNHLVNERYPSFVDALRDLDDPLTILHLFAWLPTDNSQKIRPEHIESARKLSLQWQAYCIRVRALRKVFVSVKGVYYQAEVGGQNITWLTPHSTSQVLPSDVDFRVMLTFLEFYKTLVGFVNFKLYHDLGLRYPPLLDEKLEKAANELYGLMKGLASAAPVAEEAPKAAGEDGDAEMAEQEEDPRAVESQVRLASLHSRLSAIDKEQEMPAAVPEAAKEPEDEDMDSSVKLFKEFKFFLGREVPREALLFVIRAFGGTVSWDGEGAPFPESDESITHQIVDRPTQGHKFLSREYVQPQWVFDCVNNKLLLPTDAYVVGKICPPHLSPFVDSEAEGYMPEYAETIKRMQAAASDDLPVFEKPESNGEADISTADVNVSLEKAFTRDLSKEMAGISYSASLEGKVQTAPEEQEDKKSGEASQSIPEADEAIQMGRMMMTRKARGLYDAAKMGQAKKAAKIDLLKERKKKAKAKGEEK